MTEFYLMTGGDIEELKSKDKDYFKKILEKPISVAHLKKLMEEFKGPEGTPAFVMVVDNYRPLAELVASVAENAGLKAEIYTDPGEALEAYKQREQKPDYVITDCDMPGMTGPDMVEKMKEYDLETARQPDFYENL